MARNTRKKRQKKTCAEVLKKEKMAIPSLTGMYNEPRDPCESFTFRHMRDAYFNNTRHASALAQVFWSDENMRFVVGELEKILTRETQMDVSVVLDLTFYTTCAHLCGTSPNVADIPMALRALNEVVVDSLKRKHMSAIRQRKVFMKQAIFGDRVKFLAPPQSTHGRGRILKPTTEVYSVQHNPNSRYFEEFQARLKAAPQYSQFPMFDKILGRPPC